MVQVISRLCWTHRDSGVWSPPSNSAGTESIQGRVHVGFVVDTVALGLGFHRVFGFFFPLPIYFD